MEPMNPATAGMLLAVQAALRAIIAAHPEPEKLRDALHSERESSLAHILVTSNSDIAIDAFVDYFDGLGPCASS